MRTNPKWASFCRRDVHATIDNARVAVRLAVIRRSIDYGAAGRPVARAALDRGK